MRFEQKVKGSSSMCFDAAPSIEMAKEWINLCQLALIFHSPSNVHPR